MTCFYLPNCPVLTILIIGQQFKTASIEFADCKIGQVKTGQLE